MKPRHLTPAPAFLAIALAALLSAGAPPAMAAEACSPQGDPHTVVKVRKDEYASLVGKTAHKSGSKVCIENVAYKRRNFVIEPTDSPTVVCPSAGSQGSGYAVGAGLGASSCN